MLQVIRRRNNPKYSLFVPFTRLWAVDRFLLNLTYLEMDWKRTEVIFYNDTRDYELQQRLEDWGNKFKPIVAGAYVYMSEQPALGEHDLIGTRRNRILKMKQQSTELIGNSQYVFCLEDDTICPPDAFTRLQKPFQDKNTGLVSGVQVGRWKYRIIGAWDITPLHNPTTVQTVPYGGTGLQAVSGTGWYCYLTQTELYKSADYRSEAECLGLDVCYGLDLARQGRGVYIDWNVPCAHITQSETLFPDSTTTMATWVKAENGWISVQKDIMKA